MIKIAIMCCMIMALTGCALTLEQKEELKDKAHTAIIQYLETEGSDKLYVYIDKMVAEGKLGKANAEKLKAAIPQGIDKLKEVMGELENE